MQIAGMDTTIQGQAAECSRVRPPSNVHRWLYVENIERLRKATGAKKKPAKAFLEDKSRCVRRREMRCFRRGQECEFADSGGSPCPTDEVGA